MLTLFKLPIQFMAKYCLAISILLLAIITILSLLPMPELPKVAGNDKLHHLIAYLSLAVPMSLKGGPRLIWYLLFYIAWSGGIELVQPYANRYGEWADFFTNAVGVALGAFIGWLLRETLLKSKIV